MANEFVVKNGVITPSAQVTGSTSGSTTLVAAATASGTLTLPAATDTLVGKATTDTLTNKTIAAASNSISGLTNTNLSGSAGITNANLANSSVTIGSTAVSLGATVTTFTGLASVSSTAFVGALTGNSSTATTLQTARTIGMSGVTATATSFNGSANITIPVTAVPATLLTGTIADARISGSYTGMTNLTGSGNVDFARFLGNAADTALLPSYSWTGDLNTGMYQPAADQIGFTTGGTSRLTISTTGIASTLPISASTFTGALSGNAATATTATNQSGGSVNATTGAFSGALTSTNIIQTNGGYVASGVGSGATALTTNDGYGNANLAFNHTNGIPDVTGSSARITSPVDSSGAAMTFQLGSNTTAGVAVPLPSTVLTLVPTLVSTQVPLSVTGTATATSFSGAGTGLTGTAAGLSIGGNAATATTSTTATTATNATNTAITNDIATNATMYPTWVTATTGNLPQKTSSTKLTFNPSTGTLTTTTFSGSGASLTTLNASNLSSGTIPDARISGSYTGMTNLTGSGSVDFAKFLGLATDTVSAPSFTWTGDLTTGFYRPAASQIGVAIAGVQRGAFNASGLTVNGTITVNSTFNVNGSGPGEQQDGLYVADLGSVVGTTLNPIYTTALAWQSNINRSNAISIDTDGYIYGFRSHSTESTYTFKSKVKQSDTLTTGRTITLTGDVTGVSGAFDGSGNLSFATTIAANSVALGTDTTGNYVAGATAGTGIAITGTAGEGWSPTISLIASDLTLFPTSNFKKSVRVATTANITLSGTQTIDGIAVVAGNRVLVKNQTTASQNGIYVVAAGAWTRSTAANGSTEIDSAVVGIDEGTANGGLFFTNVFKTTNVVGTTAMPWYKVTTELDNLTAGSTATGTVTYSGTTNTAGQFNGGTTTPNGSTRLNYSGYFYPTFINLTGSGETATTATHYFVETGSDGFVRPKTLANVRTELVTTAAVNSAALTTTGTVTSGTWSGSFGAVSGANLTSLNASNLGSGTVPDARISGSYTGMTNLTGSGNVDFSRFLGNATDTALLPSLSWTTDPNTGIYSPGADQVGITTGGVSRLVVNTTSITSTLNLIAPNLLPPTDNTGVVGNSTQTWSNGQFTNLTVDSTLTVRAAIDLADNDILRFGTSDDWEMYHNGTGNYMDLTVGDLLIRDDGTAGDPTRFTFGRTTGELTASGSVAAPFLLNKNTIDTSYSIPAGYNAVAAGPVVINNSITVTIPDGSTWVIV